MIEETEEDENLQYDIQQRLQHVPRPHSNYTNANRAKGKKKSMRIMIDNLNNDDKSLKRPISAINMLPKGISTLANNPSLKHIF